MSYKQKTYFNSIVVFFVVGFICTPAIFAGTLAPAYQASFWNVSSRVYYNNCYNYAMNVATNTFAQPGRAYFGYNPVNANTLTCTEMSAFASLDGTLNNGEDRLKFNSYSESAACTGAYRPAKTALVLAPGYDYHWYRLDRNSDGRWSHKQGQTPAKRTDESGRQIYSPSGANRGVYTQVCGYFCTGSSSVNQGSGQAIIE